jgi:hypothetical protein
LRDRWGNTLFISASRQPQQDSGSSSNKKPKHSVSSTDLGKTQKEASMPASPRLLEGTKLPTVIPQTPDSTPDDRLAEKYRTIALVDGRKFLTFS